MGNGDGNGERGGLAAFLHQLAESEEALYAYLENPVKTLKEAEGLTWKQRFLLLANDLEGIQKELQSDVDEDAVLYVTVWHSPPAPPTVWH